MEIAMSRPTYTTYTTYTKFGKIAITDTCRAGFAEKAFFSNLHTNLHNLHKIWSKNG